MKRFLSMLLIVCLLPGLLAVPAMGAEAAPAAVYDLLTAVEYTRADDNGFYDISSRCSLYLTQSKTAEFSWVPPVSFKIDRIELAVQSGWRPMSVEIWDGGKFVECTYKSSYDGIHYFYLDGQSAVSPYRVRVTFMVPFTGTVALRSMYGYVDRAIDVVSCDYFTNVLVGDPVLGYRYLIGNDAGTSMLPVASQWDGPYEYVDDDVMLYAECYYKVTCLAGYAQSISYLVYTVGEIDNVGVRLEKPDGNIITAVSSAVEQCGDSQIIVDFQEESYRAKVYLISADLNGYDLSDCVVTLSYEVAPVHASAFLYYGQGFYSQLTAAAFVPMVSEDGMFSRFSSWLGSHLDDIQSSLDKIADSMTATEPGSENYADKMQDASDRMNNAAAAMDSVSRPGVDSINSNLSGLVDSSSAALAIAPLSSIFSSSTLFPVFLLAFSLALAAYVLFGKR